MSRDGRKFQIIFFLENNKRLPEKAKSKQLFCWAGSNSEEERREGWIQYTICSPQEGHSCNIGNAPSLVGKKLKTVICVFWMYIWYGFTFTKMGKVRASLKFFPRHIFGEMFDFFFPRRSWQFHVKSHANASIS